MKIPPSNNIATVGTHVGRDLRDRRSFVTAVFGEELRRLLVDRGKADGYTGGMSDIEPTAYEERLDQPGKIRTWWHPLLARLLDHALATEYRVLEEVLVGKLPLRLDILLIRREAGQLLAARRRDVDLLLPLLNRFTLLQFKGPTDALQRGDLAQLVGCELLWHGQQDERIFNRDISFGTGSV